MTPKLLEILLEVFSISSNSLSNLFVDNICFSILELISLCRSLSSTIILLFKDSKPIRFLLKFKRFFIIVFNPLLVPNSFSVISKDSCEILLICEDIERNCLFSLI